MINDYFKLPYFLKSRIILFVLIILSSIIVYYNSLKNDFIWDDILLIERNEYLESIEEFKKALTKDFFGVDTEKSDKAGYYRPVITLSYFVDYKLWGLKSFGYHLTNLIFHTLNSFFVFFIINKLSKNNYLSFLSAVIFAVHPVHVESVSWISGRTDVLAATFFFISFYCYILFSRPSKYKKKYYRLSLFSYFFAVFSKEMVLTLPLILILYDYIYYSNKLNALLKRIKFYIPFFTINLLYVVLRFFIFNIEISSAYQTNTINNLITFFIKGLPYYFYILITPFSQNHYKIINYAPLNIFTGFIAITIFIFIFYLFIKIKSNLIKFFYAFFFISILPLINIIRISSPVDQVFPVAERFVYIPSLSFSLFIPFFVFYYGKKFLKLANIIIIIVILLYSVKTVYQNNVWKDNKSFFLKTLKKSPYSTTIVENAGTVYYEKENYDKALKYYNQAIKFDISSNIAYVNMLVIHSHNQTIEEGIKLGLEGLKKFPENYNINLNLGLLYMDNDDFNNANKYITKAIHIDSNNYKGYYNLGLLYLKYGDYEKSYDNFKIANSKNRFNLDTLYNMAYIQFHYKNNIELSKKYLNEIFDITETHKNSYYLMTDILIKENNFSSAEYYISKYIELFSNDIFFYNKIGALFAHQKNYKEALKYWIKYSEFIKDDWRLFNNIGTAYYMLNDYKTALKYLKKAFELNPENINIQLKINELENIEK